jgi:hypothetical protein
LLQKEGGRSAVEGPAAIAMEPMAFARLPAAGMFIHPGQGQAKRPRQPFAIATAVEFLGRRLSVEIEGKTDDQGLDMAADQKRAEMLQIDAKPPPGQGRQRRHADAQGITAGEADPPAADIKG